MYHDSPIHSFRMKIYSDILQCKLYYVWRDFMTVAGINGQLVKIETLIVEEINEA